MSYADTDLFDAVPTNQIPTPNNEQSLHRNERSRIYHTDGSDYLLDLGEWNGDPVKVHKGFQQAFASIRDTLLAQLRLQLNALRAQGKPVTTISFFGHSLGGVMAVFSSLWIMKHVYANPAEFGFDAPPAVHVITAGMPRHGNQAFQQRVARFFRLADHRQNHPNHFCHFTFPNDIVVHSRFANRVLKGYTPSPGHYIVLTRTERDDHTNHRMHTYEEAMVEFALAIHDAAEMHSPRPRDTATSARLKDWGRDVAMRSGHGARVVATEVAKEFDRQSSLSDTLGELSQHQSQLHQAVSDLSNRLQQLWSNRIRP